MIDYKKTYSELYLPKTASIIEVPEMIFIMVDGKGDPNTSAEYLEAVQVLYALSYTIKMDKTLPEYFEYVVPPLEGLWSLDDDSFKGGGLPINDKSKFLWTMMIRLPEFASRKVYDNAIEKLKKKKPELNSSLLRYEKYTEGLCAQVMHLGSYDKEVDTVLALGQYIKEKGYEEDINERRRHHEIYLSDPRKTDAAKLKTVIRHPIK